MRRAGAGAGGGGVAATGGKEICAARRGGWLESAQIVGGLAAALLGLDTAGLEANESRLGAFIETFVAMELLKQASWHPKRPALHHFRTEAGAEVDLVLEAPDGSIVGIEVKASADFGERDLRGLRTLAEVAGAQLRRGILLHTGRVVETLGPRLVAAPIATLWQ